MPNMSTGFAQSINGSPDQDLYNRLIQDQAAAQDTMNRLQEEVVQQQRVLDATSAALEHLNVFSQPETKYLVDQVSPRR